MNPVHTGTVKNGRFIEDKPGFLRHDIECFEGKAIEITVKVSRDKRSNALNRYYWGAIVHAFTEFANNQDSFGHKIDRNDSHEFLKGKFLGFTKVYSPGDGEAVMVPNSTTKEDSFAFYEYCERCAAWLNTHFDLGITPPDPEWRKSE